MGDRIGAQLGYMYRQAMVDELNFVAFTIKNRKTGRCELVSDCGLTGLTMLQHRHVFCGCDTLPYLRYYNGTLVIKKRARGLWISDHRCSNWQEMLPSDWPGLPRLLHSIHHHFKLLLLLRTFSPSIPLFLRIYHEYQY